MCTHTSVSFSLCAEVRLEVKGNLKRAVVKERSFVEETTFNAPEYFSEVLNIIEFE